MVHQLEKEYKKKIEDIKLRIRAEDKEKKPAKTESQDFYSVGRNKNCCSLWMIIALMILLFALIVGGVLYLKKYSNTSIGYLNFRKNTPESYGFVEKVAKNTNDISSGENAMITITEDELAEYVGIKDPNFPLKRANLSIKSNGVMISGRTSDNIFSLPLIVVLKPKVESGKLKIEIDQVSSGSVNLPKSVSDQVSDYLDKTVNTKYSSITDFELTDVKTKEGYLELYGTKK